MLILDKYNGIEDWQDSRGRNIIFPKRQIDDKCRGGAHACAPVFGNVPYTQKKWSELILPRHGLARLPGTEAHYSTETKENGFESVEKVFLSSTDYPFDFMVDELFKFEQGATTPSEVSSFKHLLRISRSKTCSSPTRLMPVSFGWHPYFAVHNENFAVLINGRKQLDQDDYFNPAIVYDYFGQKIALQTQNHLIKFEFFGVTEVIFWSDNKTKYLCIEPCAYREDAKHLKPGQSTAIGTRITIQEQ